MVQLQIISKVLQTSNIDIITENSLTLEHFTGYEEEYKFITEHYSKYGNVPDKATFLDEFPTVELVEVNESDRYLIDTIQEDYLFSKSAPILKRMAEILKEDSNAAISYLQSNMDVLQPNNSLGGTDIISSAKDRLKEFNENKNRDTNTNMGTGFEELDDLIYGVQRKEEFIVIVARTNNGKSWVLEKLCAHNWQVGFNIGFISPEMGATNVGFRFDTLLNNFSNSSLMFGKSDLDENAYGKYIDDLTKHTNKFIVATKKDFNGDVTVSKLRAWIRKHKLDLIAIDGISYLDDERKQRGDSVTTMLTHISEDLMNLSVEMEIPVVTVVQAGRSGAIDKEEKNGTPELESIRDSDGIAYNASKVISIRQKMDNVLEIGVKKQRFGAVGGKLNYTWNINTGEFTFIPSYPDAEPTERTKSKVDNVKKKYNDKEDVF